MARVSLGHSARIRARSKSKARLWHMARVKARTRVRAYD